LRWKTIKNRHERYGLELIFSVPPKNLRYNAAPKVSVHAQGRSRDSSLFVSFPQKRNGIFFSKGIEWSLRALESMRAVRLFLRARAVIKYVLRVASTLKASDGEQRALRKFSEQNLDLSSFKRNVLEPSLPSWRWCQITSGIFDWATMRYTGWTLKEIQSFLIRHCEHITGRTVKLPNYQVLW